MSVFAEYKVEVDWNNNGVWGDAGEDITARAYEITTRSGRDYASQVRARSIAGSAQVTLDNESDDYNSFNSTGPLFGSLVPGRRMRISATQPRASILWQGFVNTIQPMPLARGPQKAELRGVGLLSRIADHELTIAMRTDISTGDAVHAILDDAGWPTGDRLVDTGQILMTRWWETKKALSGLRDLETTEFGFIRETPDGKLAWEDGHHRLVSPHTVSQATFDDTLDAALTYDRITQRDHWGELMNEVVNRVQLYTVGAETVLWTLQESGAASPQLAPGEHKTWWTARGELDTWIAADAWATPAAYTDFTANTAPDGSGLDRTPSLTLAVSKFGASMKITLTNTHTTDPLYLTLLQARGTPVHRADPVIIREEDAASQAVYGKRAFAGDTPWLPSTDEARHDAQRKVGIYKDPIPILSLTFQANLSAAHMIHALERHSSDRITVLNRRLGINAAFFIEAIEHRITGLRNHWVTYHCSEADGFSGFIALDAGPGLDRGKLW